MFSRAFLAVALCSSTATAFVASPRLAPLRRAPVRQMADIPRITLPDSVTAPMADLDLKNPNELSTDEYNSYSAAAIAGTVLLLVPTSYLDSTLAAFARDFVFAALLGGGAMAALALREDDPFANKLGGAVMGLKEDLSIPRISLPDSVTGPMSDLDLKNPNNLSDDEYNSYSAAAIAGTVLLLVPFAYLDGTLFSFVRDFIVSALVGGGGLAFLALREDDPFANKLGEAVMGVINKAD